MSSAPCEGAAVREGWSARTPAAETLTAGGQKLQKETLFTDSVSAPLSALAVFSSWVTEQAPRLPRPPSMQKRQESSFGGRLHFEGTDPRGDSSRPLFSTSFLGLGTHAGALVLVTRSSANPAAPPDLLPEPSVCGRPESHLPVRHDVWVSSVALV